MKSSVCVPLRSLFCVFFLTAAEAANGTDRYVLKNYAKLSLALALRQRLMAAGAGQKNFRYSVSAAPC